MTPLDDAELRQRLIDAGVRPEVLEGPHEIPADAFHPDGSVTPALGGRVIQHIPSQPANLCYPIENSSITREIHREIHAPLIELNWETWELEPIMAESWDTEDTLILEGGRGAGNTNVVWGRVEDDGDAWVVRSGAPGNPLGDETRRVPKDQVESLERGTVFTFHIRPGMQWHDGRVLDARDVFFSWDLYNNPHVDCDKIRQRFNEIVHAEILDDLTVRFFYREQYFQALSSFTSDLCLLPSHLYDLTDPEHPRHDPDASLEARATEINENPHNQKVPFIGLGPYKLDKWERDQYFEAVRFDDYYETDPARRGYLDTLRWTLITDDDAAFQALINQEVDVFYRVKTEDYFGDLTSSEQFTSNFYKSYTYTATYQYTAWNVYRPKLSDPRVRRALSHCSDSQGWVDSKYKGLAWAITGPPFFMSPFYDHSIPLPEYDPDLGAELLAEAGWYDRDGNGIVDKDGEDLVIDILIPQGNKASESTVQKIQEGFGKAGVKINIVQAEWASFLERKYDRDFDGINMATVLSGLESDPKDTWHSETGAFDLRSSNTSGLQDPECDRLIDAIRVELDEDKRVPLWHALHRRLAELQPYLFSNCPPRKYAFNRKLHGVKMYQIVPGFKLRDLYYAEGTPGTRPIPTPR